MAGGVQPISEAKPQVDEKSGSRAAANTNEIVGLIDTITDATVHESAVWSASMEAPYNTDDLYRKKGDYSIYEEMMKDDQVSVAMSIKKDLILGSGWHIKCEDEKSADIRSDLERALAEDYEGVFDDDLAELLTAYEFGFSIAEKQFKTRDDGSLAVKKLKVRHPVSWLFHQDKFGNVVRYEQQGTGREFMNIDPRAIIHFVNNPKFSNPYGTSDLRAAYSAWFIKTQIVRFYAIFLEKAASPIPHGKYNKKTASATSVADLLAILKKFQTSTALVYPDDLEVGFLEARSDGKAYIDGITLFNMFIGRALFVPDLLGFQGSPTTGGSQALGREQMVVFFRHVMRRRRTIEKAINEHIVKPLVTWNYGPQEHYPKFKFNPILEEKAHENAKLWLEAVKGRAFPATPEEINHFKRICEFPETDEDELAEQLDQATPDPIEAEAQDADTSIDEKDEDETVKPGSEKKSEPEEKDEYAKKVYDFPKGDYHKKVDFKAIEKQMDGVEGNLLTRLRALANEALDAFAEKLRKKKTLTAASIEKMVEVKLSQPLMKRMQKVLTEDMATAYERAQEAARTEITKSAFSLLKDDGKEITELSIRNDWDRDDMVKHLQRLSRANFAIKKADEFLAILDAENFNYVKDWEYSLTKGARIAALQAIKDGLPIQSVIDFIITTSAAAADQSLERYARTKITEVMNKGRLEFFESTKVVSGYQWSAVLDDRTSDVCAGLHGKTFKAGTEPIPPLHFHCRSVLIPITMFEEFEPDSKVGSRNIEDFIDEKKGTGFPKR